MAAVAAEPGAAAVAITTITAATDSEGPSDPGPTASVLKGTQPETSSAVDLVVSRMEDGGEGEERRHVRPELEPAAGKAFSDTAVTDELVSNYPADRISMDRFSPCVPADPEGGGSVPVRGAYRSILSDSQPSAVFLHSFPAPPAVTEAGLSLAEPAEPTTNVTTNRAETADRNRGYTALSPSALRPGPAEDAMFDGNAVPDRVLVADNVDPDSGFSKNAPGSEELQSRGLRDSSPPCRSPKRPLLSDPVKQEAPTAEDCFGPEAGSDPDLGAQPVVSVQDLSPGTEVRVSLDHVIDDALVVSFCVGEKVFSGVLMDISKRFGPFGIPITVFPRRDDRSRPHVPMQPQPVTADDDSTKQEEVATVSPASPPRPHSWNSKPPPLFQEGAPYPPPLFIRDTYNQALPQPMPRKIKRPKRRYRYEEPTSIMNAIKLRPRQVLCDKCKGVVASGGHREARRGPVDLRAEEASRRRRPPEGPIPSELKRLRNDDKGTRTATDRRSSSGIRVASSSSSSSSTATSSRRVLRGVSPSSSASSSGRICLKKALAKGSAVDRSKAQQVLKKLARGPQPPAPHRRPKDQNQNQGPSHKQDQNKAVTRAASMKSHNQKIHFTRRLSGAAVSSSSHTPLPPRVRLKPQRYRTDDSQVSRSSSSSPPAKQSTHSSPPKPVLEPEPSLSSNTATPPPSVTPPSPVDSAFADSVSMETQEGSLEDGAEQGEGGDGGQGVDPTHCSTQDSCSLEWSSTEVCDAPHEEPPSSSLSPPTPSSSSSVSSSGPRCLSVSSPSTPTPKAEGKEVQAVGEEEEEEGAEMKRRRKSSTSSSSSSSSSSVFSKLVSKCLLPDGRTVCVGDIVWAKIYGFPWWPARVLGITVSRRGDTGLAMQQEARVSWFGSPTTSFLPLTQLSPFLESFQSRFDRKRKGPYRRAIAEAASAAKQLTPEVRALLTQFET